MGRKKRLQGNNPRATSPVESQSRENSAVLTILRGPQAKWVFCAIYLAVTIFLFRDFLFNRDMMLYGSDTIPDGIYTRQYYKDYHAEFGGIPRWNSYILGGLPFIDAMHGDTFYPMAWLKFFMPLKRALGHKLVWHVFLAGIGMYFFLRTLKLRREAAFLGGLMYLLAPSFVSWAYGGHDAKMYVIALLPVAFALLELGMNTPRFYLFALLGAVMGLLILTSHVQMAYYAYWALGLYFIFRLFSTPGEGSERFRSGLPKKIAFFVIAVILALGIGAVQLYPSYTFTTSQSVRAGEMRTGYEYATSWSMHIEEAAGMVVPSFPGFTLVNGLSDLQGDFYWGRNPFKLNSEYHGILPLLFAVMALLLCRGPRRWYLLGIALGALLYGLGADTPIYRLFYHLVPGVKNFRAPGMIIFLFGFAAVVLASQFISELLEGNIFLKHGNAFPFAVIGGVVALAVIISLMGRSFFDLWQGIFYRSMAENKAPALAANVPIFIRDLWRVVLLVSVALGGVMMFLSRKIGSSALVVLLALVVFIDESWVDSTFIDVLDPLRYQRSAPDQTVRELRKLRDESPMPFRILGIGKIPNYYAMFGIEAADGHHNNELQTYERFKGGTQLANFTRDWIVNGSLNQEGLATNNFLKVAGVRYITIPIGQGRTQILENDYAFERAFIVHDCVCVGDDDEAIAMLQDPSFDPSQQVLITGECDFTRSGTGDGSRVEKLVNQRYGITGTVNLGAPGFVVIAENIVPYWQAFVDGTPAEIYKAYGTFMAVECPAGRHEIQLMFRSAPYETGKKMTMASLLFIVGTMGVSGITGMVQRKKKAS